MRYLILFFLCSCGAFSSVKRYEPPMDEVRAQANTMLVMLTNGDFNQDGKLNWWEALLVMGAWVDQLDPEKATVPEEPGGQ